MFSTPLRKLFCASAVLLRAPGQDGARRGFGASLSKAPRSSPVYPRLHGTVTGFKHRRGYGFLLAEGVVGEVPPAVDVAKLMTSYFFTRSGLMGGYYITEGERVSFDVQERHQRGKGGERQSAKPAYVALEGEAAIVDEAVPAAAAASAGESQQDETENSLNIAVNIQMFDLRKMVESPVEPIALRGKIVRWDAAEGVGIIGELDTDGNYHADAPKFFLCLDDVDLNPGSSLRAGRYVRFCLESDDSGADSTAAGGSAGGSVTGSGEDEAAAAPLRSGQPGNTERLPVARRVIVDRTMESRMAVVGKPLAPAGAPAGTVTARTRFEGVIKDVNSQFGFVVDSLSGESIFFHQSNARSRGLAPGDAVTYMLRELTRGKHAGKKACFDVRRVHQRHASLHSDSGAASDGGLDDSEFDILDADDLPDDASLDSVSSSTGATTSSAPAQRTASRKNTSAKRSPRKGSSTDDEDDFDLLH